MRDKLLTYALAISVGIHVIVLCVVGRPSPTHVVLADQSTPMEVSVVRSPEDNPKPAHITPPKVPEKPQPTPQPVRTVTPVPSVPRQEAPKSAPIRMPFLQRFLPQRQPTAIPSHKPAGNPGGALNMGSTSSHGENMGTSGRTQVGWVPGAQHGLGAGSGSGAGIGRPEPVRGAVEGPGREAAPPPPPAPDVHIRVCAESGMIPGPNCENTETKAFRPGREPTSTCTSCHPRHKSTLADRSTPELISGSKRPKYPRSARDDGIQGSVTIEYTIDIEGNVTGVKVTSSAGNGDLDEAAVDTVKSRKYKPAVQAGIPRNYRKRETFHFALD